MTGGELRALGPLALVLLLLLLPTKALAGFSARTTATSTFRAAASFGARNVVPPSISVAPVVGTTLTANAGVWEPADMSVSIRWVLDGQPVGTGPTYTPVAADAGKTLTIEVTAGTTTVSTAPVVVTPPIAPANTGLPVVSGDLRVSATLTGSTGTWANSPTSFTREWHRCKADGTTCAAVAGRTGASYGVTTADIGFALRHRVTARNIAGSAIATSALSAALAPAPTVMPSIQGLAFTTSRLDLYGNTWTRNPSLTATNAVSWLRCADAAGSACSQVSSDLGSYTSGAADVGKFIRVRTMSTQNGVQGVADAADAIGPIVALPPRLTATVTTNVPGVSSSGVAADGSNTTIFKTTTPMNAGEWVRLDFGAVRTLVAYELTAQHPGFVEVSTNGSTWTAVAPQDNEWASPGPGVAFTPPISARYVRVRALYSGAGGWWLNDIRVWGT